jgi:hypothetical protein
MAQVVEHFLSKLKALSSNSSTSKKKKKNIKEQRIFKIARRKMNEMTGVSPYLSMIILNVKRLNFIIKRLRFAE